MLGLSKKHCLSSSGTKNKYHLFNERSKAERKCKEKKTSERKQPGGKRKTSGNYARRHYHIRNAQNKMNCGETDKSVKKIIRKL